MIRIDTPDRFALVNRSLTPALGDTIAFQLGEYPLLGKLFSSVIVSQEGETIDGEGLEGFVVMGKVTATIISAYEPLRPTT
ncbi:phage repressor protein [Pantoea agglomerans]|uniref:Phage repressor protein n=1 Tax=Enterobacter agglomerans TaxID=549 RepID=A0ACC5PUP8_ENTAG|nr:phage repressor protein [Pantoea agglomerans]MBD8128951.1 phage repressor protein [Pantoea agglomerans]MBD8152217.1 phage repressor protein [Pantoea agglomerans]MBD8157574.1 phage repressor protein [Pantoea agglomerans]MBD8231395.1 phage repressor protein [Pantoea agglomerans]MBD8241894.1 phage repressor protein [Pantoea agglomerans]